MVYNDLFTYLAKLRILRSTKTIKMVIHSLLRHLVNVIGGVLVITSLLASFPTLGASKDILQAIVGIEAQIPNDARTARILGTQRQGNGIVIDNEGLIVTIGYLILEATNVIVTHQDGTQIPAENVAYDHESGLGLLRVPSGSKVKPLP